MQRANVRMIQAGNRLRFAFETLLANRVGRELYRQNLDCDGTIEPRISRAIHFAHPARSQRSHHLIRSEFAARCQTHFFFGSASQLISTSKDAVSPTV